METVGQQEGGLQEARPGIIGGAGRPERGGNKVGGSEPVSRGQHKGHGGRGLFQGDPAPPGKEAEGELGQDDTGIYAVVEPLVILHEDQLIERLPDGPAAPGHIVGQLGSGQVLHGADPPVAVVSVGQVAVGLPVPDKGEGIVVRHFGDQPVAHVDHGPESGKDQPCLQAAAGPLPADRFFDHSAGQPVQLSVFQYLVSVFHASSLSL